MLFQMHSYFYLRQQAFTICKSSGPSNPTWLCWHAFSALDKFLEPSWKLYFTFGFLLLSTLGETFNLLDVLCIISFEKHSEPLPWALFLQPCSSVFNYLPILHFFSCLSCWEWLGLDGNYQNMKKVSHVWVIYFNICLINGIITC